MNTEKSGEVVFQYWDENNLWPELEGILSETFVKKQDYMVAPPQFADPSLNYDGYRAGVRRVNGSWKFAYFVSAWPAGKFTRVRKTRNAPKSIVDLGLPHRPPFVFVQELIACDPGIFAECATTFESDDPMFAG